DVLGLSPDGKTIRICESLEVGFGESQGDTIFHIHNADTGEPLFRLLLGNLGPLGYLHVDPVWDPTLHRILVLDRTRHILLLDTRTGERIADLGKRGADRRPEEPL